MAPHVSIITDKPQRKPISSAPCTITAPPNIGFGPHNALLSYSPPRLFFYLHATATCMHVHVQCALCSLHFYLNTQLYVGYRNKLKLPQLAGSRCDSYTALVALTEKSSRAVDIFRTSLKYHREYYGVKVQHELFCMHFYHAPSFTAMLYSDASVSDC